MSECTHDCSTCNANCSSKQKPENMHEKLNSLSRVGHVIGVVSGKGGVGKSLVTSMLAVAMRRAGYRSAILDADITGPSIPRAFGLRDVEVVGNEDGMFPPESKTGIPIMQARRLARPCHRRHGQAVLERGHLERRRLYVRRYASRNG